MPKNKKEESSSSDSSSEEVKKPQTKGKPTPAPKKEEKKPAKKEESSDDSSSSSSDAKPAKKAAPAKKEEPKKAAKKKESSSEESDSSSEEAPKKPAKKEEPKKAAKKAESSDDSDASSSEEEKKPADSKKRKADDDGEDEQPTKKAKTESGAVATATAGNGDNNRLFLGNLSFKIDDDAIRAFFKDVGELTDIHWVTDKETGKFYGTGFVAFATADEAKAAVAKNGQEVLGRPIRIDFAQAKGDRNAKGGAGAGGFQKGGAAGGKPKFEQRAPTPKPDGCTTVFLGNLSFQVDEAAIRSHFGDCGEITSIRWVERDGQFKGCGFLEFADTSATDKAVAKNGSDILGRAVRVDFSAPKPPRQF